MDNNTEATVTENPETAGSQIPATTDTGHTLRVTSLYKQFGHKKVVRGVEFSMQMGEVLGLLGPNGAGKTTTFYMVVGFYKPTAGDVFLDPNNLATQPPASSQLWLLKR